MTGSRLFDQRLVRVLDALIGLALEALLRVLEVGGGADEALVQVVALGLEPLHIGAARGRSRTGCAFCSCATPVVVCGCLRGSGVIVGRRRGAPLLGVVFVVDRYCGSWRFPIGSRTLKSQI